MFYILTITVLVLLVIWRMFLKKHYASDPPELGGQLPFIGHGFKILGDSVKMYDGIKEISSECIEIGGASTLFLGPVKFYFIADPEDSVTISNLCLQKHYVYDFARPLFANGILNADVPTWKKHRKLLNPAFSQQVLNGFINIFNTQAQRLVDQLANEVGKLFDHEDYVRINNLESVCLAVTGVDPDEYATLQKEYVPCLEELLHIFNLRIQKFWYHSDIIFNMSPLRRRQDILVQKVAELSNSIIEKKKLEMKNYNNEKSKPGKLKPFIDLILELAEDNSSFTDEQIRGETSTIIAGGHDTSASTMTFALTLLGSHPQIQEKAYEEIIQVLGSTKSYVDKDDLSKLVYTEAILKETIRLYPVIPIIARQLDKDIKLKNYTLKANTGCIISIYGINRHKMWGSDVNEFKPERWLDKTKLPDPKYNALFGLGRRFCIGKTYAMMSMKTSLTHVLRKYKISSDMSNMVVKIDTMIRPVSGYYIALEKRDTAE